MYMFGVCHKNGDPFLSCDGQASVVIDDMAEFQTMLVGCPVMASCIGQWICFVGENLQEDPIFNGKIYGFWNQSIETIETMDFPIEYGA